MGILAPFTFQHLVEPNKLGLEGLRYEVECDVVLQEEAVPDGGGTGHGEVDALGPVGPRVSVGRHEGEG